MYIYYMYNLINLFCVGRCKTTMEYCKGIYFPGQQMEPALLRLKGVFENPAVMGFHWSS